MNNYNENIYLDNYSNKKKLVFLVLTIIMFMGIAFGLIYFTYYKQDERENKLSTGLISINFTEGTDTIVLNNTLPVIDEIGLENQPYEFSITNTSDVPINAQITLEIDETTTNIPLGAVRYALYINNEMITKNNLGSLQDNNLYKYPNFGIDETINCKLIMWIDYYYTESAKSFNAKLKVIGESFDVILEPTPLKQSIEKSISNSTCTPTIEEDGITYISGTTECIDFNYVWYSGKLWRITAINSDGTIKMITDDAITTISYGSDVNFYTGTKSYMYQWLNEDFLDTLYNYENIIVTNSVWNATNSNASSTSEVSTKLPKTTLVTAPVGLLNSYEYYKSYQNTSYGSGYLNIGYYWLLLNPYSSSYVWIVNRSGNADLSNPSTFAYGARPSINLQSGITISGGSGTSSDPYTIIGDKEEAVANTTLLNTRTSGEYVNFDGELYRIVGIENNTTKINKNDYVRDTSNNVIVKRFSSSNSYVTYGGTGTTEETCWAGYLNNTWYNSISTNYKNMLVDGTYYLGTTEDNYKGAICLAASNTVTTKDCEKTTTIWTGKVGLSRYGEMFASQQGSGYSSSEHMWLVTPYSSSIVWQVYNNGRASSNGAPSSNAYRARPSINLSSSVKITAGLGTKTNPFEISM